MLVSGEHDVNLHADGPLLLRAADRRQSVLRLSGAVDGRAPPSLPHEFVYVLKGVVAVHTEHYEPVRLEMGDSLYMDSQMAHIYTSLGGEDAQILMVWLSPAAQSSSDNTRMVESLLNRKA